MPKPQFLLLSSTIVQILSAATAFAGWTDAESPLLKRYPLKIRDGYVSSLWGACDSRLDGVRQRFKFNRTIPVTSGAIERAYATKGAIHPDSHETHRTLTFVFPGAFSDSDSSEAKVVAKQLHETGQNVISLPNPWGREFIGLRAAYMPGDFLSEGETLADMVQSTVQRLSEDGLMIKKIKFLGISYGAFEATIVASNLIRNRGLPISEVLLLSPPINLYKSMKNVELSVEENIASYSLAPYAHYANSIAKICSLDLASGRAPSTLRQDARAVILFGFFHNQFIASMYELDKDRGVLGIPGRSRQMASAKYRRWRKNARFTDYLGRYLPHAVEEMKSEKGTLSYWLRTIPGFVTVRILSTKDDFINGQDPLAGIDPSQKSRFHFLNEGGHYGFRGTSWYKSVLSEVFTPGISGKQSTLSAKHTQTKPIGL